MTLSRQGVHGRLRLVALLLAGGAALGVVTPVAAADAARLPATIRVLLSVDASYLRIEPPADAEVRADGRPLDGDLGTLTAGSNLRYLTYPAAVPAALRNLALRAPPAAAADGGAIRIGPYPAGARLWRDARRLYGEFGRAARPTAAALGAVAAQAVLPGPPSVIDIRPIDDRDATTINGKPYRGRLRLSRAGDSFDVVNDVPFDAYLASVVGAEMPASWELEALKAQAVAARTYALRNRFQTGGYDICDNQNCQAYHGLASESDRTRAAVAQTAGQVATFDGELIQAFYSANAGDFTESAEHVWGDPLPYLQAVASPTDVEALSAAWGAQGYRWRREIPLARLSEVEAIRAAGVGQVRDLRVLATAESGRPLHVQVVGRDGALDLAGDAIRTVLGLPSSFVTIMLETPRSVRLLNPTARRRVALIEAGFAVARVRRSVAFDAAPADVRLLNATVLEVQFAQPARAVFEGRGFGHGVGMSQWGAQGMARAGASYDAILQHYYPGIEVRALG